MSQRHCLSCQHWWRSRGGTVCPKCRSAVIVAAHEIIDNPFESTGRVWMTVAAFLGLPLLGMLTLLASPELKESVGTGKAIGLWYLWFAVGLAVLLINRKSYKALRTRCWHKETLPDRARARAFGTSMPPVHIIDADAGEAITTARAFDALAQSGTQLLNWLWRDPRATGGSIAVRFTMAGVFLAAWLALMFTRHFTLGLVAVVAGLIMLLAGIAAVRAGQRRRREPWG
jgi:hypothetical protein